MSGWECRSVSVCCHVYITGAWQLRNSDVQFGVTSEAEMLPCHSGILWQYAISTRCHAWRDMTLWMSVLMHFRKGLSVCGHLQKVVPLILILSVKCLIHANLWYRIIQNICCNMSLVLYKGLSSVHFYINTKLFASIVRHNNDTFSSNNLGFMYKTGTSLHVL